MDNYINILILVGIIYYLYSRTTITDNIDGINNIKEGFFQSSSLLLTSPPKDIVMNNQISMPVLKLATAQDKTYPLELGYFFRHNIYPVNVIITRGSIDNLNMLLNDEVDLAFIDEDILSSIIEEENGNLKANLLNKLSIQYDESNHKYQSISNSIMSLAVLYYQYMLAITKKGTNIVNWIDLNNKNIGVLNSLSNSHNHLSRLIRFTRLKNQNFNIKIKVYDTFKEMSDGFKSNDIDAIYITTNQKNYMLRELSDELELRFISPFENKNYTSSDIRQTQEEDNQNRHLAKLQFKNSYNKTLNLNYFYKNINSTNHIKTKATRMLLVTRNKNENGNRNNASYNSQMEILIKNFISNINNLQKHINKYQSDTGSDRQIMNDINDAFIFEEQVSASKNINIHPSAKKIYKKLNLIKEIETKSCKIN